MANEIATKIAAHKPKLPGLSRKEKLKYKEELKALAAEHVPAVVSTLASFVKDRKIPASSRVAAGNALLDRFAGRPLKEDEKPAESQYERMSEGQLLGVICDSIWGLSSEARALIAETIVAAEQGIRIDADQLGRGIDEEAKAQGLPPLEKLKPPKREPRR